MEGAFWDSRFDPSKEYGWAYGRNPNDFLLAALPYLQNLSNSSASKCLSLGEGEGRNAIFLAKTLGCSVHSIDLSSVGQEKCLDWAVKENIADRISYQVADLSALENLGHACYDVIISIWCHMPSVQLAQLHNKVLNALKPDGLFIFEAYTPENIGRGVGGPKEVDLNPTLAQLQAHFPDLKKEIRQVERDIQEGPFHHGLSSTVQAMVWKTKLAR